jgi:hypothetical protein
MVWFYVSKRKKIVPMINMDMDTDTVTLNCEKEGLHVSLRRTRIKQSYSHAPKVRTHRGVDKGWRSRAVILASAGMCARRPKGGGVSCR